MYESLFGVVFAVLLLYFHTKLHLFSFWNKQSLILSINSKIDGVSRVDCSDRASESARQLEQRYLTTLNRSNYLSEEQQLIFNYENKNKETNNIWGIQVCSVNHVMWTMIDVCSCKCGRAFVWIREWLCVWAMVVSDTTNFLYGWLKCIFGFCFC